MKPRTYFYIQLGLLLAVVVGGATACSYLSNLASNRSMTLRQKLADQQVADSKIAQLNALKKQYQKVQQYVPLIDAALPRDKKESEIVLQLEKLASNAGMGLPGVAFTGGTGGQLPSVTTQTAKQGDLLIIPIQVQLSGSYEQMQTFLKGLEGLNRYATVTSLNITTAKPKVLNFAMTLNMYVKP